MRRLFRAEDNENEFLTNGYTKSLGIDQYQISALQEIYLKLQIKDTIGLGYNVGMNSNIKAKRIEMQSLIIDTIGSTISNLLDKYVPYSATFMNKVNKRHLLIKAHQDFSYTNEIELHSFMCWIPLIDVSFINGALGYISGSHNSCNYTRGFPSPMHPTPVLVHQVELMKFFKIVPMKKGEAIFFNHKTIHGSFPNVSGFDRLAVGVNFIKKGVSPLAYIFNPEFNGKKIDEYEVYSNFITHFSKTELQMQYSSGKINIPYDKIDTKEWTSPDLSYHNLLSSLNLKEGDANSLTVS